jgi:hypothetical protein
MKTSSFRKRLNARTEVEYYGFKRSFFARYGAWLFIGIVALTILMLSIFAQYLPIHQAVPNIITGIVAIGALILGYQQWRAARNEKSLEKFYERLELTNQKFEAWPGARELLGQYPVLEGSESEREEVLFQRAMYTFRELDNLEYALAKYKLGYMSSEYALRSLKIFQHRCDSPAFSELALRCCTIDAAYQAETIKVVKKICSTRFSSGSYNGTRTA